MTGELEISLHPEVEAWYLALCVSDPHSSDLVADALNQLEHEGPAVGRPLVDRIKSSEYHNMKELRPPSAGTTEIRMLFAFDPLREAIVLVAGDKSGQWQQWYREAIPLADKRFAEHLAALKERK
ncbi:type II toxin-antitoxin system RelE/ParE family toxin [Nocardia sp. NPDC051750]|uniref:type II toxin-antitoxin system RelE/ParE family toxin n=1 Tax=Nocardia sp. NPDC051750 TaxID=3364325 RepID=UPI0037A7C791